MNSARQRVKKLPWKTGVRGGFECLSLDSLRRRKLDDELIAPQRPDFHLLIHYRKGGGDHLVDFERVPCPPHTLVHVSPQQVHAFDKPRNREADLLVFQDEILPADFFNTGTLLPIAEHVWPVSVTLEKSDARRFQDLFQLLRSIQDAPAPWQQDATARYLALSITAFGYQAAIAGDAAYRQPGEHATYYRFLALVEEHFRSMRGAQWYARELNCAYRTLCRACLAATGQSPKALIDARTMREARRLLGYSRDPVYAIAEELGFSESTNFVKFFVRLDGRTPEAFRKAWGAR